ncbi:hypothetical protein BDB01DRAFT_719129 [Pilobolus umbonatus]|nr:hypothetical protein BDB01DRAFT_719129 [Pilobolus umbonatus]
MDGLIGKQSFSPSEIIFTVANLIPNRFKSLLDLFAILWFIIGNYLIFSNSSCSESSPFYYYTILAWILLGYLLLIVPLLLCLSVVFCLPLVLVALRAFNINISNVMVGGTKEELMTIPIYRFKSSHHTTSDEDSKSMQHKKNIFQRLISHKRKNRNSNDSCQNEYKMISIEREEDAVCSICLSEYENNDLICKLW